MKIRLNVSVKVRGGRIFIPGVYDSSVEGNAPLFKILDSAEPSSAFDNLEAVNPVEAEITEEDVEEEETEEAEEEEVEEAEDKPKKKKKKKKVI